MAQHDYVLDNAAGAAFRADTNSVLSAIVTQNSGATEPATMFAYQWWADTTTGLLKIRNAANTAWVTVGTLASANLGLALLAGSASQAFSVASPTSAAHAVRADTIAGRNVVINGGFRVNQRTYTSAAVLASGSYGHDRWKAGAGGGDYSFTQLASNTTITISANKTLIQVIEDKNVASASYVLSWTGTAQARYAVNSATPAGSYAASPILITGQTPGTVMSIEFGNGASAGTLGVVQLEAGTIATPFESRPYGTELALCQRYYQTIKPIAGLASGTANFAFSIQYPVQMRATPTATCSAAIVCANGASPFTGAATTGITGTNSWASLNTGGFTGLTANAVYIGDPSSGNILLSAEL